MRSKHLACSKASLLFIFRLPESNRRKNAIYLDWSAFEHIQRRSLDYKAIIREPKYPSKSTEKMNKIDPYVDDGDKEATLLWQFRNSSFACAFDTNDVVVFFRLTRSVSHWPDNGWSTMLPAFWPSIIIENCDSRVERRFVVISAAPKSNLAVGDSFSAIKL